MSRSLKVIALASTFAGFAATAGVYDLGFDFLPPRATSADGTTLPLPRLIFRPVSRRRYSCSLATPMLKANGRFVDNGS